MAVCTERLPGGSPPLPGPLRATPGSHPIPGPVPHNGCSSQYQMTVTVAYHMPAHSSVRVTDNTWQLYIIGTVRDLSEPSWCQRQTTVIVINATNKQPPKNMISIQPLCTYNYWCECNVWFKISFFVVVVVLFVFWGVVCLLFVCLFVCLFVVFALLCFLFYFFLFLKFVTCKLIWCILLT